MLASSVAKLNAVVNTRTGVDDHSEPEHAVFAEASMSATVLAI